MRTLAITAAALSLSLAACSPAEQNKAEANVNEAAADVAEGARDVANSPAVEKAGDKLEEAAKDTGTVLKNAAAGAVSGAREGMAKAEGDQHTDHDGTTTTTTTTVETKKKN